MVVHRCVSRCFLEEERPRRVPSEARRALSGRGVRAAVRRSGSDIDPDVDVERGAGRKDHDDRDDAQPQELALLLRICLEEQELLDGNGGDGSRGWVGEWCKFHSESQSRQEGEGPASSVIGESDPRRNERSERHERDVRPCPAVRRSRATSQQ